MDASKRHWILGGIVICLFVIPTIHAWGKDGHHAVCKIAENYLTDEALAAVKALLPDSAEGDLASVCAWADEVRYKAHYGWSKTLHYADTPDFRCNYDYCRDCHDTVGRKDRCVTGAIYNYTKQLMSEHDDSGLYKLSYNLTEALMFLAHFIGDVHQPMHLGFLGDLGGNSITIRWYRRKTNLHHVWDNMIIESALKTFYSNDLSVMTQAIQNNITDAMVDEVSEENCNSAVCPDPYASESISLACRYAYRNATPGSTLGDDYFYSRWPVVESRLAQGGVRLATLLNRIFFKHKSIAEE
ncbi:endonuclease 4-like [Salvia miltiorrhiza]|uniref:endonuclease 4-like n=1 Tax=Salvia miltiorrhiza TaxID=226208 RepID=UPI0025AC165C|nr:endonuclease 4-like [Salvia miltiorrhiza]